MRKSKEDKKAPANIFTVRLPNDLYLWLKAREKAFGMNQTIIEALEALRYREENEQPYSEGWKDGYDEGYSRGKEDGGE